MRINRLFQIVITIMNRGTMTAKELAEKFEVSTRTIYRDIDELSAAGIPIYTVKGSGGGISLLDDYIMNKALISEQESESLLFALKTLQATNYPEIDIVLDKMSAIFSKIAAEDWIDVDFSHWGANKELKNKFQNIKKSILKSLVLEFNYINSYNKKTSRIVYPIKLFFKGQTWYLSAYCKMRKDVRTFKISRIKNLIIRNQQFQREVLLQGMKQNSRAENEVKNVDLRLKFSESVLYQLYDYYDDNMLMRNQDGSYTVDVTFPENEWVYSYILSFGSNVEVLEPLYVRKEITRRLIKNIEKYQ